MSVSIWDARARDFDLRAGLNEETRTAIIEAVFEIAQLSTVARDASGELELLDVGAGTGELGLELAARGITYVGLDGSAEMLRVFRERATRAGILPRLEHGNANERWPIADASVRVIFGSRSLHWIDPAHLVSEAFRVGKAARSSLLIGRVRHDPDGPRARIRRRLMELLEQAGHAPRRAEAHTAEVARLSLRRGARLIERRTVAAFTVERSPAAVLRDFRDKPGIGGVELPGEDQERILAALTEWTARVIGNMDAPVPMREEYSIEGATLHPERA